ncbi:MAG: hypothetical protein RLZZ308_316 [Candidatus Parcubacteria bacterium]|jgi:nitroimidazol reductase NimA-like FMN-containing flavoprotein (pyridoxamine 5'-phosphate oxidase superfamily)
MTIQQTIKEELLKDDVHVGVLSTVNRDGNPESASMYYVYDDELAIYFVTREGSRKYNNIIHNPHVCFVVTRTSPAHTVQLEGVAHEVADAHEEQEFFGRLISLAVDGNFVPPVSQREEEGRIVFVKMKTQWARFGNFETATSGDEFEEGDVI